MTVMVKVLYYSHFIVYITVMMLAGILDGFHSAVKVTVESDLNRQHCQRTASVQLMFVHEDRRVLIMCLMMLQQKSELHNFGLNRQVWIDN